MSSAESIRDGDYKIQQISRLLESGGTMLAQHCNVCGAPFFRYHGEILCPVCSTVGGQQSSETVGESESVSQSRVNSQVPSSAQSNTVVLPTPQTEPEVVFPPQVNEPDVSATTPVKDDVLTKSSGSQEYVVDVDTPVVNTSSFATIDSKSLENTLLQTIENLAAQMVGENDTQKIKDKLDLIERTVVLAERIKKL